MVSVSRHVSRRWLCGVRSVILLTRGEIRALGRSRAGPQLYGSYMGQHGWDAKERKLVVKIYIQNEEEYQPRVPPRACARDPDIVIDNTRGSAVRRAA